MIRFHEIMRKVGAKLVYSEDRLLVGLRDPKLRDLISVGDVLVESLGISFDDISVVIHDSHVALIAPFGAEREVVSEEGKLEEVDQEDVEEKKAEEVSEEGVVEERRDDFEYEVEDGKLRVRDRYVSYVLDYEKVKELYDLLPERSTIKDIIAYGDRVGLKLQYNAARLLMRVFSRYVDFDAELVKDGRQLILVKHEECNISEEIRKQLAVEKEIIGTPWEVR